MKRIYKAKCLGFNQPAQLISLFFSNFPDVFVYILSSFHHLFLWESCLYISVFRCILLFSHSDIFNLEVIMYFSYQLLITAAAALGYVRCISSAISAHQPLPHIKRNAASCRTSISLIVTKTITNLMNYHMYLAYQ